MLASGGPALAPGGGKAAEVEGRCRGPFPFEVSHPGLYRALDKAMRAAGLGKYLDEKALAVSVVDLTKAGKRYYAGFNDNEMMYAASLPKIAILLAVIEAVNDKEIKWTHEHDVRLQNMIRASSNPDASWATDLVGLLEIERVVRSEEYCFYDNQYGGLWVGRAYRRGGASNRDPLHNISHGATSRQAARFYTMLDAGRLVSKHWSFRMLGLMSPPKHFHKFVGGLNGTAGVAFLARKSGTWRTSHSDSALIQHHANRYVAVGIADLANGESVMRDLIIVIDAVIMDGRHRKRVRKRPSPQVKR
jgi:beta-lactamase class A